MKTVLLFIALSLLLVGCAESDPLDRAKEYISALQEERWESACLLIEEDSREAFESAGGDCADQLEASFSDSATGNLELLSKNDTVARFLAEGTGETLSLRKNGGEWYITFTDLERERAPSSPQGPQK